MYLERITVHGFSSGERGPVALAAIPDLTTTAAPASEDDESDDEAHVEVAAAPEFDAADDDGRSDEELGALMEEADEQRELDDDTFFAGVFHAVVVLEEPEVHLHAVHLDERCAHRREGSTSIAIGAAARIVGARRATSCSPSTLVRPTNGGDG